MKQSISAVCVFATLGSAASAGGLDRTRTPIDIIFQNGTYATAVAGGLHPHFTGRDTAGVNTKNVGKDFAYLYSGFKFDIHDKLSLSLILEQPYGAAIEYKKVSPIIGGTYAYAKVQSVTTLLRYKPTGNFSVYGGPRYAHGSARVKLAGTSYGPANGYKARLHGAEGMGFVVGAAYEIPEKAIRVALTYHSRVRLKFPTRETIPLPGGSGSLSIKTGKTTVHLPQSVNLDLQTGINKTTLIYGRARWSQWGHFEVVPHILDNNLSELRDVWEFEGGVLHKFTDRLGGKLWFIYDPKRNSDAVSPLAPLNGEFMVGLAGSYALSDKATLNGSVNYFKFGDATAKSNGVRQVRFKNNYGVGGGVQLEYKF